MRRAFRRRCICTSERGRLGFGRLRTANTMANRWSNQGLFGRGLDGSYELEPENKYRREFGRTCILLRGLGGHLRRGLVGDESKLMLQINTGGKSGRVYSFMVWSHDTTGTKTRCIMTMSKDNKVTRAVRSKTPAEVGGRWGQTLEAACDTESAPRTPSPPQCPRRRS